MEIVQDVWGFTPEGEVVVVYTITNAAGASVRVTNLGASLVAALVPDRNGVLADVVLGYADWHSYLGDGPYMGKSVGRYANRIGGAKFVLDGVEHVLPPNERGNQLHGGTATLANRLWESRVEENRVVFSIFSPDGDGGYPGSLRVEAAYYFSDAGELEIVYSAECDMTTVVNFTNHSYFNLSGGGSVLNHELQLRASNFVPTRDDGIPTGEIWPVEGTPMDFRKFQVLGDGVKSDYQQVTEACGYDRCWLVDDWRKNILAEAGVLRDPASGRRMTILTSQPGVQVYTGNFLQGSPISKSGMPYENFAGVALECQGLPDAPNHANFPSQTLRPGERYIQKIVYAFSAE